MKPLYCKGKQWCPSSIQNPYKTKKVVPCLIGCPITNNISVICCTDPPYKDRCNANGSVVQNHAGSMQMARIGPQREEMYKRKSKYFVWPLHSLCLPVRVPNTWSLLSWLLKNTSSPEVEHPVSLKSCLKRSIWTPLSSSKWLKGNGWSGINGNLFLNPWIWI